jgi:hypothetical protein
VCGTFISEIDHEWSTEAQSYSDAEKSQGEIRTDLPAHVLASFLSFWLEGKRRLFFGGDVMMRTPSGRFVLPMAAATPDLDQAKRSIQKVAEMDVATICLGHGKPRVGDAASAISAFATSLRS